MGDTFPPLDFGKLIWDSRTPTGVPTIDYPRLLAEFENGNDDTHGTEKAKLKASVAWPGPGIFYLSRPPITEQFVQDLLNETRGFLSLPTESQVPYHVSEGEAVGLAPFGFESTEAVINAGTGVASSTPPGRDQCIKFSYELEHPGNKWPSESLKKLSEKFLLDVMAQSQQVLKWIVELYPPDEEQIEPLLEAIGNAIPFTRHLLYSEIDENNSNTQKMHPHVDISFATTSFRVPASNGFKGLMYRINGEYVPAPVLRNTASMHVGEALLSYYQGSKKMGSPEHFVAMPSTDKRGVGSEHTSLVTFLNPNKATKVPVFTNSYYKTFHEGESYKGGVEKATAALFKK